MLIKFLLIAKKSIEYLLFFIMSALIIILCLHVFLRYIFRYSFSWTSELSTYLLAWLTFLGAILALFNAEHIGFTTLKERVSKKVNLVLLIIKNIVISFFLGTILIYGIPVIKMGFKFKAVTFPVSKGFLYLVVPISFFLMLLYIVSETVLLFYPDKLKVFYEKIRIEEKHEKLT